MTSDTRTVESTNKTSAAAQPFSNAEEPLQIPIEIDAATPSETGPVPLTTAVPLPKGALRTVNGATLRRSDEESIPVQTTCVGFWADGSIKWLLIDCVLPKLTAGRSDWQLVLDPHAESDSPKKLTVDEQADGISVDTGTAQFRLGGNDSGFTTTFRSAVVNESGADDSGDVPDVEVRGPVLTDDCGATHPIDHSDCRVESDGPTQATIVVESTCTTLPGVTLRSWISFFAGTSLVRLVTTLHNTKRARHRGGLWDLGDAGSLLFRDFSLTLSLADEILPQVAYQLSPTADWHETGDKPVAIYQDSSGGENWQSLNHVDRNRDVPCRFRGFEVIEGETRTEGLRAEPIIQLTGSRSAATVAVPEFWQNFPKSLDVDDGRLSIRLFPHQFASLHELQGGEQKTHTVWLDLIETREDGVAANPLDWVARPPIVRPAAEWTVKSRAVSELKTVSSNHIEQLDELLDEALSGEGSLLTNRERADEYGWRNFGEIYADHEQAYYSGDQPLVSHYNNQFDMIYGFLTNFLRTGDRRWFELGDALARHVIDIDIYHTHEDKSAYCGGLFWHSDHYKTAATATHRTFSQANTGSLGGAYGGGPSSEHNYTTGLLLYYYLTGNPQARDAVIGLADWVINMDDGRKTVFGLIDLGPTGLASSTADPSYHGPGRGAGNSINALLDAYELTRDTRFLKFAEVLIRRCIHPQDDVTKRDLLNVELRWSYTVFLTSLDKYLDMKAEANAIDAMYRYAQSSLIAYATWMVAHEQPYFDQREKLEYPTEAWTAQEFRKANVLRRAARHVDEPLRSQMAKRGQELADRAWSDLWGFETRACARSIAILMKEGLTDAYFRCGLVSNAPRASASEGAEFEIPEPFVPQKQRVRAQLKSPAGLARTAARLINPARYWQFLQSRRTSGKRHQPALPESSS